MNIEQAKTQIKNAVIAYFTKNSHGEYIIPIERQRPIFLVGAPGIGKTAVMEQIASELGIGLVSYSMTHHTRQSALGLPFITKKVYDGVEYNVSEYTMSEIIASIYEYMKRTGKKEGILFLDEINCVSETLAPAMLQFLQYKIFGNHSIPNGWVVVTAGNPPEYNKSVHDFDTVTIDRLKRIDVEPDFEIWKKYAVAQHMHPAVIAYLSAKPDNFYRVRTTVDGKELITARGWEDISQMLQIYEKNEIKPDEDLIKQYIHCKEVARDFAVYYDMFASYKVKFNLDAVLAGSISEATLNSAKNAGLDERVAVVNILTDNVTTATTEFIEDLSGLQFLKSQMKDLVADLEKSEESAYHLVLSKHKEVLKKELKDLEQKEASRDVIHKYKYAISKLDDFADEIHDKPKNYRAILQDGLVEAGKVLAESKKQIDVAINSIYTFFETAFDTTDEIVLFTTAITNDKNLAMFVASTRNEKYLKYVHTLNVSDRRADLLQEIDETYHSDVFTS